VHGLAGVPAQIAPVIVPTRQTGHGWALFPVSTVRAANWMFSVDAPVEVSSVPAAGWANVFSVHTDVPPFGTGSGVPKRQPVFEQSNEFDPVDTPVSVGPTVQFGPVHANVKRVAEAGGVGPSATVDSPPPSERNPQRRFFRSIVPAASR
jgi:hypothetical protein